jgi:hypothetical protein
MSIPGIISVGSSFEKSICFDGNESSPAKRDSIAKEANRVKFLARFSSL